MAVSPLMAASIFGGMFDPKHQAEMAAQEAAWRKLHPFGAPPPPMDPNQGMDETPLGYGLRRAVETPLDWIAGIFDKPVDAAVAVHNDARQGVKELLTTPRQKQQAAAKAAPAAGSVFPTSFSDPAYDAMDAHAAQLTGVPLQL